MIILLPIIYRVLTIPGGAGFLPSTVSICLGDGSNYTFYRLFAEISFGGGCS